MARLFNGGTQRLITTDEPATAVPVTLAAWVFPEDATTTMWVVGLINTGRDNHFALTLDDDELVRAHVRAGGGNGVASTATAATIGAWNHVAAVFTSATLRAVFLAGANKATNTSNVTPGAISQVDIGARVGDASNLFEPFDGRIAEPGIWDVALSDDEIAALARGISPLRIRRSNLLAYWPLLGIDSPETDLSGHGRNLTMTGTPARADHAPITRMRML